MNNFRTLCLDILSRRARNRLRSLDVHTVEDFIRVFDENFQTASPISGWRYVGVGRKTVAEFSKLRQLLSESSPRVDAILAYYSPEEIREAALMLSIKENKVRQTQLDVNEFLRFVKNSQKKE